MDHRAKSQATQLSTLRLPASQWQDLPSCIGVYRFYDEAQRLLYVGKAKSLQKRVSSYFQQGRSLSQRTRRMAAQIAYIIYTELATEHDALLLENNLIKTHQPHYNILLRNNSAYPYLFLSAEPFPRLLSVRNLKNKKPGMYIGPFTNRRAMWHLMHEVRQMCKLRSCSLDLSKKNIQANKYRVCLEYHIGNCKGPCQGFQNEENYLKDIAQAESILKGKLRQVRERLKQERKQAVAEYRFEEAHRIQEALSSLDKLQSRSVVSNHKLKNLEVCTLVGEGMRFFANYMHVAEGQVILSDNVTLSPPIEELAEDLLIQTICQLRDRHGSMGKEILSNIAVENWSKELQVHVPQRGDKYQLVLLSVANVKRQRAQTFNQSTLPRAAKLLRQVQREMKLKHPPMHIECFDISNLHEESIVGAMVCFKSGRPFKEGYRHYHIRSLKAGEGPNDFASMKEVLTRRYTRLIKEKEVRPDLIVIDGGKGQLGVAKKVLKELGLEDISVVGLAKRLEEVFFPGVKEPLLLSDTGESIRLLQRIRDETHRRAISFHRNTRNKKAFASALDAINGIGEATKKKLFQHYDSIEDIQAESLEALHTHIGKARATKLLEALKLQKPAPPPQK